MKSKLFFAVFICIFTASCKKSDNVIAPLNSVSNFKLTVTGNIKPSDAELKIIETNLNKLSTLTVDQQKSFLQTLAVTKTLSFNSSSALTAKKNITINDYSPADYASIQIIETNMPDDPDAPIEFTTSPFGIVSLYKWVMAYNVLGLFSICSNERCELLDYGLSPGRQPANRYGFNTIVHSGSYISGLSGPLTWTESSNFNYFTPGNFNAYFNTQGILAVAGTGTADVVGRRYVSAGVVAGYIPN